LAASSSTTKFSLPWHLSYWAIANTNSICITSGRSTKVIPRLESLQGNVMAMPWSLEVGGVRPS
jgi:hypothetical protein